MTKGARLLSDSPIGVDPQHVLRWILHAVDCCDHTTKIDGLCTCQKYIKQIIEMYDKEIKSRAKKSAKSKAKRPLTTREILEAITDHCQLEIDLALAQEHIVELNRRIRALTELLHGEVAKTCPKAEKMAVCAELDSEDR